MISLGYINTLILKLVLTTPMGSNDTNLRKNIAVY